jgi:YfiH family protein
MLPSPFPLFHQFNNLLECTLLTKKDNASSDADLAKLTGVTKIVGLKQEHSNRAVRVSKPSSRLISADAVATDIPNLALSIRFADCQNAVIFAPDNGVICLVHAGWRGVRLKIMTSSYQLLKTEWNIRPEETFVGLGPSLCTVCADFTDPSTEAPELKAFHRKNCIDLQSALDQELSDIGVPLAQRERMQECTRCSPETYFTYRGGDREAVQKGYTNCFTITLS